MVDDSHIPAHLRERLERDRERKSEILDMTLIDAKKSSRGESVNITRFTNEDVFRYHHVLYKTVEKLHGNPDEVVPGYKDLKIRPNDLGKYISYHKNGIDLLAKYLASRFRE